MYKTKTIIALISKYTFLSFFAIISAFPLVWLVLNSFRKSISILSEPFALPTSINFANYTKVWVTGKMSQGFGNSLFVSFTSVALLIIVATMVAYAIARVYNSGALYTYFALGIMIPVQAILIPNFQIEKFLQIYNTHFGLILLYVTNNLTLAFFLAYAFMISLPREMEESAFIDGCSRTRAFVSIILPLSMPAISTVGILSFLHCWNDYILAAIFLSEKRLYTITLFIYTMIGEFSTDFGALFAGMGIAIIPVLVIYIFFQEQISHGLTAGAVVG